MVGFAYSTNRLEKQYVPSNRESTFWLSSCDGAKLFPYSQTQFWTFILDKQQPKVLDYDYQLAETYPYAKLSIQKPSNLLCPVNHIIEPEKLSASYLAAGYFIVNQCHFYIQLVTLEELGIELEDEADQMDVSATLSATEKVVAHAIPQMVITNRKKINYGK
jgi:hypothetical protein